MVLDRHDIDRAADRTATLRKVGYENTIPVVVGAYINPENEAYARLRGVEVQLDDDPNYRALLAS